VLPARYPHLYKIFTNREKNITWQQKEEVRVEVIKVLVKEAEGGMVLEEELEIEAQRDSPENNSSTIINCIMLVLYITQVLYLKSRSYRTWIETKSFH